MTADALLGPSYPQEGWVPAPRYLMRRARILALMMGLPPGRLLEAGPGAGTLLIEFARRGFQCEALETSQEARRLADRLIAISGTKAPIHKIPPPDWDGAFDYLFSFDVLEHIEDDRRALANWASWLRQSGVLLLSVPARMNLWTKGDEWAGHFRRYEWTELTELLELTGFEVDRFECYGFPLTNVSELVSAYAARKSIHRGAGSAEDDRQANNDRSGIDRQSHLRLYPLIESRVGRAALQLAISTQEVFLNKDWGSGYIVRARKR